MHRSDDTTQHDDETVKKKTHRDSSTSSLCNLLPLDFLRRNGQPALRSPFICRENDRLKKLNALKPAPLYRRVALFQYQRPDIGVRIQVPK